MGLLKIEWKIAPAAIFVGLVRTVDEAITWMFRGSCIGVGAAMGIAFLKDALDLWPL
jgi:hypothetical protein